MDTSYAVFCGIDVGKGEHHAVGLDPSGGRLYDKALPNDETKLRAVFDGLAAHGPVLVIVDQPNTIGALPVTIARACGHDVAYLPGLSMRRIADLYPGQAKTDARDAFIIAFRRKDHAPHPAPRLSPETRRWPNSRSSSASTTTSPAKPPVSATGSADCSLPSTQPSNGRSVPVLPTPPSSRSSRAVADPPESDRPANANSPRSRSSTLFFLMIRRPPRSTPHWKRNR